MADAEHRRHSGHARHAHPQDAQPRADARLRHRAPRRADLARRLQGQSRARCSPRCSGSSAPAGSTPSGGRPRTRAARSSTRSRAPAGSSSRSRPRTGRAAPPPSRGCSRRRASPMSLWRQLTRGLRALLNRRRRRPRRRRRGPALPRRGGRRAHGAGALARATRGAPRACDSATRTAVREQVRAYGWENAVGTVLADLRYAARRLRGRPGLRRGQRAHAGAGHRRHHGDLQRREPGPLRAAAVPGRGPHRDVWDVASDGSRIDVTFGTFRELRSAAARSRRWR